MRFGTVVLAAAVLLVGCAPQPDATPTPSATALPFATDEEAFAAAEATYRAYVDALNEVDLQDPATFEAVYAWTTGELLAEERRTFSQMHADGWTVTGNSEVTFVTGQHVRRRSVEVAACLRVAEVRLADSAGTSVISPDRPDQSVVRVVLDAARSSPNGLLISAISASDGAVPCGG
jgi:hypothetical protein